MGAALDHIMIVAGDSATWSACPRAHWDELTGRLGPAAAAAGARWLTIRPYGAGEEPDGVGGLAERTVFVAGRCAVVVDPRADGRQSFAAAAARAAAADALDEKGIVEALYAPAESEPDLIVICGATNHLPPSLVWELAYGELVYADATLDTLGPAVLEQAIGIYHTRTRRFGGL